MKYMYIYDDIYIYTWNPKQPFINGCFNGMIPNLYIENGCHQTSIYKWLFGVPGIYILPWKLTCPL